MLELTTLSGCRTLAIDFMNSVRRKSILSNFIFLDESEVLGVFSTMKLGGSPDSIRKVRDWENNDGLVVRLATVLKSMQNAGCWVCLFLYTDRRSSSPSLHSDDYLVYSARDLALYVGISQVHAFTPPSTQQLDLPEAHGDGIERQPAEDGEAIFIPAMSSINLYVGLTTLSGCRTLAIDFIEFCNDESILSNFIFWTESEGDGVDVRHCTFTLTFINVGEFINYGEQHAFLRRILCRHRNVIRYLVFFNYEVGEVHLIAFEKCGMEIMTDYLYGFTIEEYANADAGL
nr:hypothetical protein Iba_chr10cCG9190 [Ipomoea batatas]